MEWAASPQELFEKIAGPQPAFGGGKFKNAINDVVEAVSDCLKTMRRDPINSRRVENIWRGNVTPKYWEMDAIRAAANARLVREAKHEFSELETRLARIEALLIQDADFHSHEADALREMERRAGGAMDSGGRR